MPFRWTAALFAAALLCGFGTGPAGAEEFLDAAGRRVMLPDPIRRAMPASSEAAALIYVVAPEKLVGWTERRRLAYLPARYARLPVVGRVGGPFPTAGAAAIIRYRPDVVIDQGVITPERIAFADAMQQQTGVPYILLEDSIIRIPPLMRVAGALLGATDRGQDLSRYSRRSVESLHGRLLINPTDRRSRIYYGRGADGLETPLPGSPQGEAIDEAGALNVTGSLGRGAVVRVRPEQILAWNPDLIIAEDPRFYDRLYRDRYWRQLTAVRQKHVYLAPSGPFGWIDDPPGVNRIIGLYWLSTLLYPEASQDNLRARIPELYEQFYAVKLTDAQLKELIARAGVPDDDAFTAAGGPLGGLGALTNPHGPPVQAAPRVTPITPDNAPGITGTVPGLGPPGRRGSPSQGLPADQGLPNPPPPQ